MGGAGAAAAATVARRPASASRRPPRGGIVCFRATPIESRNPMRTLIRFQVPSRADTAAVSMRAGDAHRFDAVLMGPQMRTSKRSNLIGGNHETRLSRDLDHGDGRRLAVDGQLAGCFLAARSGGPGSLRGLYRGGSVRRHSTTAFVWGWENMRVLILAVLTQTHTHRHYTLASTAAGFAPVQHRQSARGR